MDLYTLNENFIAKDVIDEFMSAIWTERYWAAGDTQLVVPATKENVTRLAEGTFLALRGSKEVMQIQTQSIKNGLMTLVGDTLPKFLNQRFVWFANPASSAETERITDYTDSTRKPGEFIADVVSKMVINPTTLLGAYAPANIDWANDKIDNLSLGAVDVSGVVKRLTIPTGPLYDSIAQIAAQEGVGFTLYLDVADPVTGYSLKFTTYSGKDRTSGQSTYPLVRLVPALDSVQDLEEVRSIAEYKNVVYVYYKGIITKHLAEPTLPEPEGFARRVLVVNAEGEPVGRKEQPPTYTWSSGLAPSGKVGSGGEARAVGGTYTNYTVVGAAEITAFRDQHAKDALANHNYIKAVDGQTSPENDYQFGKDYGLGDILELEGLTGLISKARVTEYIRSEDQTGEKEYPTISVID